ncbi:MAG: histidine kinase [Desulfamplus sp.]|nr:histidine kinase [Desulfamplus sp.]
MNKLIYLTIFYIITAIFILAGCASEPAKEIPPEAANGVLNLTQWDFESDGNIWIDGEWKFYWNKFLYYNELKNGLKSDKSNLSDKSYLYAEVPNLWTQYQINDRHLEGQGFATYKLSVKTNLPPGTLLGLEINTFSSAYNIYINEKLAASNGRVGKNNAEEIGEYRPQTVIFAIPDTVSSGSSMVSPASSTESEAGSFDIIIHVSNFKSAEGGFWNSIKIGSSKNILAQHDYIVGQAFFILGVLYFSTIFFTFLFLFRRELRYTLYFAIFCFLAIFAIDMSSNIIITNFISTTNFNWFVFIWYASTTWIWFFWLLFLNEFYRSKFSTLVLKAYFAISIISQILYSFTTPLFYTEFTYIWYFIETLILFSSVVIVLIAVKKGCKRAWLNLICVLIVLISYIYNFLYWINEINYNWGEFLSAAVSVFMLIQIFIQAERVKQFYDDKRASELKFLQSQIKPHFLYNTLNTFVAISRYDMDQARSLLIDFSKYLRCSFDFKDLGQLVPIENEISLAQYYARIEMVRFEGRCDVVFDIDDDLKNDFKIMVPLLVLQPIIENGLVHGILPKPEGGRLDVSIKKDQNTIIFSVKDNGAGMGSETLEKLLSKDILYNAARSGVGIQNIDSRLRSLYGKGLTIKSTLKVGTTITWQVKV